jgi:diaminopimelate decarboxylase
LLNIKLVGEILLHAIRKKDLITESDSAVIFYDLSLIRQKISKLQKYFPPNTLHAAAIKANPLLNILRFLKQHRIGAEGASLPELYLAQKAGFPSNMIVFDSPIKTNEELTYALKAGVHINADSLDELERIAKLKKVIKSKSAIGIRINPQIGIGKIHMTSVAGEYSKFGVPIKEFRTELLESFVKYDWLTGVHLHIGSQGYDIEVLTNGSEIILDFVTEVNDHLKRKQINIFDIGGGMPVSYNKNVTPPSMKKYCELLRKKCPELFSNDFKIITEFGRWIFANAGWAVSKVEYVKKTKSIDTIMIHLGADMFIRKIYNPNDWHHEISVLNSNGKLKSGRRKKYCIAGPLCFAGDVLEREILLPKVDEGDYIVIHDTGAYTSSLWSRYNSRQFPKVIGYEDNAKKFILLKERESLESIKNFWS